MSDNSEIKFRAIGNNGNRNTQRKVENSNSKIERTVRQEKKTDREMAYKEQIRSSKQKAYKASYEATSNSYYDDVNGNYQSYKRNYSGKRTSRSRKAKQANSRLRALAGISFLIVMSCILTSVIFVVGKFGKLNENSQKDSFNEANIETNELSEDTKNTLQGFKTIAIFGVDKKKDDVTIEQGVNSDVNIIASINYDTHEIRLVSVYRDTYVNVNEKTGEYNKLNSAYKEGGPQQALNALNRNLDLALTDYVTVDWAAVADVINALGGIELDIDETELYWINGYITDVVNNTDIGSVHLKKTGLQKVDGVQAVAYCRIRYGGGDDFKRTERQRIVLEKILEKVKQTDLLTLNKIIDTTLEKISTNLEIGEIVQLATDITKYQIVGTTGFPAEKYALVVDGVSYVFPATLETNVNTLHQFLFANEVYSPSQKLKEISNHIIDFSGVDETFDMHDAIEAEKALENQTESETTKKATSSEKATTKKQTETSKATTQAESSKEQSTSEAATTQETTKEQESVKEQSSKESSSTVTKTSEASSQQIPSSTSNSNVQSTTTEANTTKN